MGTVVLSIDAELGWGHCDSTTSSSVRGGAGRDGWKTLIDLLDTYDVPATWAVIGHLFLDDCDGSHPTHPLGDGWFSAERNEWADRPDIRFAPDLIRSIGDSDVDHEISCHTFSHVDFGDSRTTQRIARAELVASLEAAERSSVSAAMSSVTFPRNNVGFRDVLAEWGFTCYRGVRPGGGAIGSSTIRKIGHATMGEPPLVEPTIDEFGLVNVPASLYLFDFEGSARRVCEMLWDDPIVAAARRGIDAATRGDGVFHLWLQPNDLVTDDDVERLRTVLAYVNRRRQLGGLEVKTMRAVAQRVTADPEPPYQTI